MEQKKENDIENNKNDAKGTTDKGTTDKGTTDKGTTDKGTTDKGTTDNKEVVMPLPPPFKYEHIESMFSNYIDNNTNNSNIIDIIGVYIKGQKILYIEAKTTCEQRLTFLMIPSILFTVACSILNLLLKDYVHGNIITSILNGFVAFILALINYLKLDARAEAHRGSAYKYDKLLTYIEFQSFKQLFLDEAKLEMTKIIEIIENDVKEIKETNQFILPEVIRYNFPSLSNINVFSEVKRININETILKNDLTNIYNEINTLEEELKINKNNNNIKCQLEMKILQKNYITDEILKLQNEYICIDKQFKDELEHYSKRNNYRPRFCDWFKV